MPAQTLDFARWGISNLFLFNFAALGAHHALLSPAWSLDIELQFYFTAPAIIWLLRKNIALFAPLLIAVSLGFCAAGWLDYLPAYLQYFVIGICADLLDWTPSKWVAGVGAGIAAVIVALSIVIPDLHSLFVRTHDATGITISNAVASYVVGLLLIPLALLTVRFRSNDRDKVLADMAYTLYLFHSAAVIGFAPLLAHMTVAHKIPYVAALWLVSLVSAYLGVIYFDRPISAIRERFVNRQVRAGSAIESAASSST
jgi:peptidoglycan/LPS O-acetylase OafA/YrhL